MDTEESSEGRHHRDRRFGSFRGDLALPGEVDAGKMNVAYRDGILTVTLPKTEKAKAIKVRT